MGTLREWRDEELARKWGPAVRVGDGRAGEPVAAIYDHEPVVELFLAAVDWHLGKTIDDVSLAQRLLLRQLPADAAYIDALLEIAHGVRPAPRDIVRYVVGLAARLGKAQKSHERVFAPAADS